MRQRIVVEGVLIGNSSRVHQDLHLCSLDHFTGSRTRFAGVIIAGGLLAGPYGLKAAEVKCQQLTLPFDDQQSAIGYASTYGQQLSLVRVIVQCLEAHARLFNRQADAPWQILNQRRLDRRHQPVAGRVAHRHRPACQQCLARLKSCDVASYLRETFVSHIGVLVRGLRRGDAFEFVQDGCGTLHSSDRRRAERPAPRNGPGRLIRVRVKGQIRQHARCFGKMSFINEPVCQRRRGIIAGACQQVLIDHHPQRADIVLVLRTCEQGGCFTVVDQAIGLQTRRWQGGDPLMGVASRRYEAIAIAGNKMLAGKSDDPLKGVDRHLPILAANGFVGPFQ